MRSSSPLSIETSHVAHPFLVAKFDPFTSDPGTLFENASRGGSNKKRRRDQRCRDDHQFRLRRDTTHSEGNSFRMATQRPQMSTEMSYRLLKLRLTSGRRGHQLDSFIYFKNKRNYLTHQDGRCKIKERLSIETELHSFGEYAWCICSFEKNGIHGHTYQR